MSAFDAQPKTGTRANKAGEDDQPPDWGRLNPKTITAADAIQGVSPGVDVKIVHGDYGEALLGKRTTYILAKDTQVLEGDHEETIEGVATVTIKGGRYIMIGKVEQYDVLGHRTAFVLGTDVENYSQHREITEPSKFELKGIERAVTGLSLDAKGSSFETAAFTMGLEGLKVTAGMFNETNELLEAELSQLCGLTKGLDGKIGILSLYLNPRLNGMMTVSSSAPMGA